MNWLNIVLSGLISAFIPVISIKIITQEKIKFKSILIFALITFPSLMLNYVYFEGITRLILNIIMMILAFYFSTFNKNISKAVYYTFVYEILAFAGELLLSLIVLGILQLDLDTYANYKYSLLFSSLFNCVFLLIVSNIKSLSKNIVKLNKVIGKNNRDWIYIIILVLLMVFLMTFNRYNLGNTTRYYINVGMIVFVLLSLIYVISNKFSKQRYEDKYNQMMEYVCKYENIINEQGKKNHEYNNQLMVISGYVDNPEKLKEYLKLVMEEHKVGQNYMVKQLGCFPNGGIKGLMYNKLGQIEECKIKPYFYIDPSIKDIFETKFDLNTYRDITKLLGVYIDNAIDAAKDANPKEIELEMKVDDRYLTITISNTYNKNVDINKVGKKGFSTKGSGHGFGLSIVKDIAKNNDKIETFSDPDEKMYKQVIIIDLK